MLKKTAPLSEKLTDEQIAELKNLETLLEKHKHQFNLLSYFENIFNENVWTRVFTFFLDSEEKHLLGNLFFNYWFDLLSTDHPNFKSLFLDKLVTKPVKIISRTEWSTPYNRRIDLILELNDSDGNVIGVIGLENKLDSSEQEEQISDYQKALSIKFPAIPKIILYSTPDGRNPTTALKKYRDCPCLPISYSSFKNVFEHFSKNTSGELQLIINSTFNYLDFMLARVRKKEIQSLLYDPSLPFQERNRYSPIKTFFNDFIEYIKKNHRFPFKGVYAHTFSTDEISFSFEHLRTPNLIPKYVLKGLTKEPRVGDYFVVRVMIYCVDFRTMKSKDKQPTIELILKHLQLPFTKNEPKHWGPWINIWTSRKYQLIDLGEKDFKGLLDLLHETIDLTYPDLKKKFDEFVKLFPDMTK